METTVVPPVSPAASAAPARAADALGGDDFFQLLITQLTNQDPLQPTSNQELLQQISSIREIELSSTLTRSLQSLTDQQRFGSAAALIGRVVTGHDPAKPEDSSLRGSVVGIRFGADGRAVLQLDSGTELPLDQVDTVVSAAEAGRALIGQIVTGSDSSDPKQPRTVEGLVVSASEPSPGSVVLELDTGEKLNLRDVTAVRAADGPAS